MGQGVHYDLLSVSSISSYRSEMSLQMVVARNVLHGSY